MLYTWAVFEPCTKTEFHQQKTGMFSFVNKDLITMPHSQTVMFLEYQNPAPSNKLRTSKIKFYHQKHFETTFLTCEIQPSLVSLGPNLKNSINLMQITITSLQPECLPFILGGFPLTITAFFRGIPSLVDLTFGETHWNGCLAAPNKGYVLLFNRRLKKRTSYSC